MGCRKPGARPDVGDRGPHRVAHARDEAAKHLIAHLACELGELEFTTEVVIAVDDQQWLNTVTVHVTETSSK